MKYQPIKSAFNLYYGSKGLFSQELSVWWLSSFIIIELSNSMRKPYKGVNPKNFDKANNLNQWHNHRLQEAELARDKMDKNVARILSFCRVLKKNVHLRQWSRLGVFRITSTYLIFFDITPSEYKTEPRANLYLKLFFFMYSILRFIDFLLPFWSPISSSTGIFQTIKKI